MSVAFDTLKLADRLEAGGFTAHQAKTAASAISDAFSAELVTKADLREELAAVRHEMQEMRHELKADIANAKADMTKWLVGAIGFQTFVIIGAVVALLKLFIK